MAETRPDAAAAEDEKAASWIQRKRDMSPANILRLGDELRRRALAIRQDWPTEADRAADRGTHARVSEALRAVIGLRAR
jgi:hypothetical protein